MPVSDFKPDIVGEIVGGIKLGKSLGCPTINLRITQQKKQYEQGVYICCTTVNGEKFYGVMHFGVKSRGIKNHDDKEKIFCEMHLFDFDKNVYGEEISVKVLKKIRNVREFNSDHELKKQIGHDIQTAKKFLQHEFNQNA